jgi:hypothetical protein
VDVEARVAGVLAKDGVGVGCAVVQEMGHVVVRPLGSNLGGSSSATQSDK